MLSDFEQQFPKTCTLIQDGIDQNLHRGIQLSISTRGNVVADAAVGMDTPDTPLTVQTWLPWLSAGKPVTATAVMQAWERGQLQLDHPVAEWIPEFAEAGKADVTVFHLLTHTAALKPIATGWPRVEWESILQKICRSPLRKGCEAGQCAGYDPQRSWFVLGEMLQRIHGRPIEQIVRDDVLLPSGMQHSRLAFSSIKDSAADPLLNVGAIYERQDSELKKLEPTAETWLRPAPGSSMLGPASDLRRFYEMLLNDGISCTGQRVLQSDTVAMMTARHREGAFDQTFQHRVDFGLGMLINSNRYGAETVPYGFGRFAGEGAFGHGGAQSSIGFADPENQMAVAVIANGRPGEVLHNQRFRELCSALYEDLGIAAK